MHGAHGVHLAGRTEMRRSDRSNSKSALLVVTTVASTVAL
jgi:hypothetical protein